MIRLVMHNLKILVVFTTPPSNRSHNAGDVDIVWIFKVHNIPVSLKLVRSIRYMLHKPRYIPGPVSREFPNTTSR